MTEDVFAEMQVDAMKPDAIPDDKNLAGIAALVQKQLDLEEKVSQTEEYLKAFKLELRDLQTKEFPAAMTDLNLATITTADGHTVSCDPFVGASIRKDKKDEAHDWLRNNGFGDLIKTITSIDTGRDLEAKEVARKALVDAGFMPDTNENVHSGTLKVWVREQVTAGKPIPLELFGAFLGQKTTIKKG
tara:strand:- start:2933 stop:3496 length:564 start_codon:yes stop_codon:yes gene_type:complete